MWAQLPGLRDAWTSTAVPELESGEPFAGSLSPTGMETATFLEAPQPPVQLLLCQRKAGGEVGKWGANHCLPGSK